MQLRSLDPADVAYILARLRAADRRELLATEFAAELPVETVLSWARAGMAWVADGDDALPVALIGVSELHPNVWRAWCLATDNFPQVVRGLTRFVKRVMIPNLIEHGAHRCDALSIDGHPQAHKWLRLLGATQEARLRRYGRNGEDFLVFRWDAD